MSARARPPASSELDASSPVRHDDSGADLAPWLSSVYRVPPVAFSPDWGSILGALAAREDTVPAAGVYDFDSGRAALRFAIERLADAAPLRRQVVVPAYTCYSVAAAVESAGLELVVCDIDPCTLDFAPDMLASVVGEDTLCIVAAQLFGCGVDLQYAAELARRAGCHVVEDAAQASDPSDDAYARGKATLRVTSTGRGKPLSTGGGGFVALYERGLRADFDAVHARLQRRNGCGVAVLQASRVGLMKLLVHPRLFWAPAAIPALRIGATVYPDAIVPRRAEHFNLRLYERMRARFERERSIRRGHAQFYSQYRGAWSADVQPSATNGPGYAPHRFPVYLSRDRDEVAAALRRAGREGVAPVYPMALTHLERVRRFCANPNAPVPGAEWVARRLLTLPTHCYVDAVARARALQALNALDK